MFINCLEVISSGEVIRKIKFHRGLNLIVDKTVGIEDDEKTKTGNGVGKTTVLRLIDFCLGKSAAVIYTDPESKKVIKSLKKELESRKVCIRLTLSPNENKTEFRKSSYVIERNFLLGKRKIQRVNGKDISDARDIPKEIGHDLFDIAVENKPTFRQIIGRSMRIDSPAINNTLKYLGTYPKKPEYETLFLFLFGINLPDRTPIVENLKSEKKFLNRIESTPLSQLELELEKIKDDIEKVNEERSNLNIDPKYEEKITELSRLRYKFEVHQDRLSNYQLRVNLIRDAQNQIESGKSTIDIDDLKLLYQEAEAYVDNLQVNFQQLVNYNNKMIEKRIKFVGKDLPNIQEHISAENMELRELRRNIDELTEFMSRTDASKRLDKLSEQLGVLHEDKGKTVEKIEQIDKSNNRIQELNKNLKEVDQSFFSSETKVKINNQLSKFNKYFANISQQLYGEQYGVAFEVKERNGQRNYDFYVFAYNNSSSGKKQGEVAAFDIGYILFARHEQIPVLDFVLYDKKELMYGGQLLKISEEAEQNDIQVIFPILSDKLPEKLNNDDNIVLYLSEDDKLFRF